MSCKRKLLITEEEKITILSLYGLMSEQKPSAVTSTKPSDEISLTGNTFFANGMWKALSTNGKQELDSQLGKAAKFLAEKKGRVVYVKIIAGESQVTNTDNEDPKHPKVDPGYLSDKRAQTMKEYLTKYFDSLKSQGIISKLPIFEAPEVVIGANTYTKGVDNPNDPKYKDERFVKVELKIQSPEKCVVGLKVEVMYNRDKDTRFPCRGNHTCDEAKFAVKLNGVNIGTANLNNGSGNDPGGSRTSGPITVTDTQAKQIIGNDSKDIIISLQCLSGSNCHSSTPEIRISKGGTVIYHACSPSIAARGETNDKTILVLDNCGNLKQKGTESTVKNDEGEKRVPKNVTFKVWDSWSGDSQNYVDTFLIPKNIITKNPNNTYTFNKDYVLGGLNYYKGDVITKVLPKNNTSNTGTAEKLPADAKVITVKTVNNDTPEVAIKKFIDGKKAVKTTAPDIIKLIADVGYNQNTYKTGQYLKLVKV